MTIMFAYGSNLNLAQMRRRCPAAVALGRLRLPGWRLVFRGVADVIPEAGAVCYGGAWRITPACERTLDIYEGIASGLYRKEYIPIKPMPDGLRTMLVYCMNSTGIMPPSEHYLDGIRDGYCDFSMPQRAHQMLDAAVRESWDDKHLTYRERQRRQRNGRPRFAARPRGAAVTVTTGPVSIPD